MKTRTIISIFILTFLSFNTFSQNFKFKHFEIDLCLSFWSPKSPVFQANSTTTNIFIPEANYTYTTAMHSGFGNSFGPDFKVSYYFKNDLGIAIGFAPYMMTNDLFVQLSDSTSIQYNNYAEIMNITIGFEKRIINTEGFKFSFGAGANLVPDFGLHLETITQDEQTYLEAQNGSIGLYVDLGLKIQIYKFIYLKTEFKYSYIPIEDFVLYGNNTEIRYQEVDLGGTSIICGLSFVF